MKLFRIEGCLWFKGFGTYNYRFLVVAPDEKRAIALAFAKGIDNNANSKPEKFDDLVVKEIRLGKARVVEMESN